MGITTRQQRVGGEAAEALIASPGLLPDGVGTFPGLVSVVRAHAEALAEASTGLD